MVTIGMRMLAQPPLRLEHDLVEAQHRALDAILVDADVQWPVMLPPRCDRSYGAAA